MQSRDQTPSEASPDDETQGMKIPSDFLLSVATAPLMLVLMGGKFMSNTMLEMSRSSEAVFQGERLPVLNFPHPSSQEEE
ncbi:hypothetical protein [Lyngbya sp. PCC 8106]|uniref:hypothetical protein n=1 Tax=Lyngbya sp. (strain PCC 8106) TaxID=313612 RepID=UPI0000EAABFC|nr:hypothetical protein [Lyngbya sp. PCC 8106]EAW37106.1 hypothetical protein L8106_19041 [Lyngbya sp. PCC 8106]